MKSKSPAVHGTGTTERENFCPTPCVALEDEVDLRKAAVTSALLLKTAATPQMMVGPVQAADLGGQLILRIYNYADVEDDVLRRAKRESNRSFTRCGIQIDWLDCPTSPQEIPLSRSCASQPGPNHLILNLLPHSMSKEYGFKRGIFGFALPTARGLPGSRISLFFKRVLDLAYYAGVGTGFENAQALILGPMMAHEVGHLLLGPDSHSASGVMGFPWNKRTLTNMERGRLNFTANERLKIHKESDRRADLVQHLSGQVDILVYDYASLPDTVLARSHQVVKRIFRKAAIETSWIQCSTTQEVQACNAALERGAVIVKILPKSRQSRFRRGVDKFGAAFPARGGISNSTAYVFDDAIARLGSVRISKSGLLGHVVAHEVGHLLLGPNSHSRSGIMQLHWDDKVLQLAATGTLLFTTRQAQRMQERLTRRSLTQQVTVAHRRKRGENVTGENRLNSQGKERGSGATLHTQSQPYRPNQINNIAPKPAKKFGPPC